MFAHVAAVKNTKPVTGSWPDMSVGEISWPKMHPVAGVKLGAANARIKNRERNDVLLIELIKGSAVAGVFTKNAFCAEPVKICKEHLASEYPRYLLINSGNANACTGEAGREAALQCCDAVANYGMVSREAVLPFSTGVIGQPLPAEKIITVIPEVAGKLAEDNWPVAAQAIMTTDTKPKGASIEFTIEGERCCITGIAKGAGMIKPNMATMLAFVATDISIEPSILQILCKRAADASFNRITIDGDTSTNDSCMLIASGANKNVVIDRIDSKAYQLFEDALVKVCQQLAQHIVRDGEGATKFVKVLVEGGLHKTECLDVAYQIAHSPLVKTALFASDANWGRIVAAVGNAKVEELNTDNVNVWINDLLIVEQGGRAQTYTEEAGQSEMQKADLLIKVDLGRGKASETIWTTDLSHEYVKINAEYRT